MRHWKRGILILWFCLCSFAAFNSAAGMLISFAPRQTLTAEAQRVELDSIERVRRKWAPGIFLTSAMLILSAGGLVVIGWRRVT
jgi:hypothetical protein